MIFHSLKLGGLYKPNRRDNMSLKLTLSNKKKLHYESMADMLGSNFSKGRQWPANIIREK